MDKPYLVLDDDARQQESYLLPSAVAQVPVDHVSQRYCGYDGSVAEPNIMEKLEAVSIKQEIGATDKNFR